MLPRSIAFVVCSYLVTLFASSAQARNPEHELRLTSASGPTGSVVEVSVLYSNSSSDFTLGWSFGVAHDWSELQLQEVTAGSTLLGVTPEFEEQIVWAGGWTSVVVLSFDGSVLLLPAVDQPLYQATYEVLSICGSLPSEIEFTDQLGFPAASVAIETTNGPIAPSTENADIVVTGSAPFQFGAPHITVSSVGPTVGIYTIDEPGVGTPSNVPGFSMGAAHDPAVAQILDIEPTGPLADPIPDFFQATIFPNGWTVGVVYFGFTTVTFPEPTAVIAVTYEPASGAPIGTTSPIVFTGQLGTPQVANIVVVGGTSMATCGTPGSITSLAADTYLRGDSNDDGALDLADAIMLLSRLFDGEPAGTCVDADDVNDDGMIDIADVVYGLDHTFAGGPPPPAPSPTCGAAVADLGCDESSCP